MRTNCTVLKTNQPFAESEVEKGTRVWDITSPLHDAKGHLVGTVGMDVKPQAEQTKESVLKITGVVVLELEREIPSKAALFQPVP